MAKLQEFSINKFAAGLDAKDVRAKLFTEFNKTGAARISAILMGTEPTPSMTLHYYGELSRSQEKLLQECSP